MGRHIRSKANLTQLPTGLPDGANRDRGAVSFPRPLAKVLLQTECHSLGRKGYQNWKGIPGWSSLVTRLDAAQKGFGNVSTKRGQEVSVPVPV